MTGPGPLTDRLDLGIVPLVRGKASCRPRFGTFKFVGATHPRSRVEGVSVLDHGKRRGAYRVHGEADQIDLGNEPPLSVDGAAEWARRSPPRFRAVVQRHYSDRSLRRSSHGRRRFRIARRPEQFRNGSRAGAAGACRRFCCSRSHRHRAQVRPPAATERIQQCQRRVDSRHPDQPGRQSRGRARPRRLCASPAILRFRRPSCPPTFPPSIPQKMLLAEGRAWRGAADDSPDAEIDAEVSFVTADLGGILPRARIAAVVSIDDVLARVREAANWSGSSRPIAAGGARPTAQSATGLRRRRDTGSLCRLRNPHRARKRHTAAEDHAADHRRNCLDRAHGHAPQGESVTSVLRDLGAAPDDIKAITACSAPADATAA